MKLIITRNSSTIWNQEGKLQGWQNSKLTTQGIEDAYLLKQELSHYHIDAFYSSPLGRAKETAKILFGDREIIYDERLKEMNFGDYEGMSLSDLLHQPIYQDYVDLWNHPKDELCLPNGESYREVRFRFLSFLNDVYQQHANDTIFLTIHGMLFIIIHGMFAHLKTEQLSSINQTVVRGCSISIFDYDGKNYKIEVIGKEDHLKPLKEKITYSK